MPTLEKQFRVFLIVQREFHDAVAAQDFETARLALAEIEGNWSHTEWPRLKEASARFLTRHRQYAEFYSFKPEAQALQTFEAHIGVEP